MRVLVVSDLHGDLDSVAEAVRAFEPSALLCCGDWGDDGEVSQGELDALVVRLPVLTTFGNHDPLARLGLLRNRDGIPVLMGQGEVRSFAGLRVAAAGGIWAKSHRLAHYVTDEDVARHAQAIVTAGPVDVLLTHGCPVGVADRTPSGRHGGQRCFLDLNRAVAPRFHLCGHLHVPQEHTFRDGRRVLNVGATPEGSVAVIETDGGRTIARLDRFTRQHTG